MNTLENNKDSQNVVVNKKPKLDAYDIKLASCLNAN